MSSYRLIASFAVLVAIPVSLVSPPSLPAQETETPLFPAQPQQPEPSDAESKINDLSAEELEQVKVWIEELPDIFYYDEERKSYGSTVGYVSNEQNPRAIIYCISVGLSYTIFKSHKGDLL